MKPFLVDGVGKVLSVLKYVSLFPAWWLRPRFSKEAWGGLVELWVVSNFSLAVVLLFGPLAGSGWTRTVVSAYAAIRLVEIIVFQFNSQIYGGYPGKEKPRLRYTVLSYRRSILLAGLLYIEAAIWFACLYRLCAESFPCTTVSLAVPLKALYFSVVTITTLGYGDVSASDSLGFFMVIAEAFSGLFANRKRICVEFLITSSASGSQSFRSW
jgi:hypothetical protein